MEHAGSWWQKGKLVSAAEFFMWQSGSFFVSMLMVETYSAVMDTVTVGIERLSFFATIVSTIFFMLSILFMLTHALYTLLCVLVGAIPSRAPRRGGK